MKNFTTTAKDSRGDFPEANSGPNENRDLQIFKNRLKALVQDKIVILP